MTVLNMLFPKKLRECLDWRLVRGHLCTLAMSLSLNATWRVPRDAARYGPLPYLLVYSMAMALVALPTALLHLATSHLSQQDAVGIWRAVPFFKGVGYLRLVASLLGAVHTAVYVALTVTVFLYSLRNSIPFWECTQYVVDEEGYTNLFNASDCLEVTFLAPVQQRPEAYAAVALVAVALWIALPFLLYNPVKMMKRFFYVLGPAILTLGIVVLSGAGEATALVPVTSLEEWRGLVEPRVWFAALTQALLSSQITNGFLLSVGDVLYSSTNVKWTACAFVGTNLLASFCGVVFWRAVSEKRDASLVAALVYAYDITESRGVAMAWSVVAFVMLILSGIVSLLTLLHPVFDHLKRVGPSRWRAGGAAAAAAGAAGSVAALAGGLPAVAVLDELAVPLMAASATAIECLAFVGIYGWKTLAEDVEFLTSAPLKRLWSVGWFVCPALVLPATAWWVAALVVADDDWTLQPWAAATLSATILLVALIVLVFATISVLKQVQYDVCSKLKSSFTPSRHWGPRDPITHYYWLARREGGGGAWRLGRRAAGGSRGSLRSDLSKALVSPAPPPLPDKRRAHSDDWLWTGHRRIHLTDNPRRSRSLDWAKILPSLSQIHKHRKTVQVSIESIPIPRDLSRVDENNAVTQ